MENVKKILNQKSIYLLLLPVFFVFHGYTENYGFINLSDCVLVLVIYGVFTVILFGLLFLYYKNSTKSALFSGLLLSFYFFFGAIFDFLKAHVNALHRYSIVLPFILVLAICAGVYLKKSKRDFFRITFFLNSLLLVYLLIDTGGLILKMLHPNADKLSVYGFGKKETYLACNTCPNPDIYFFVFDEYTSSVNLAETFHYDNSALDSFFVQHEFHVLPYSYSNYNFTPFSIASLLNMNYINGIPDAANISGEDYWQAEKLIKNNVVIRFLSSRDYDIVNYSIFDLAGNPSPVEVSLLPVKAKLITEQTLYSRVMHDIGWNFNLNWLPAKWLAGNSIYNNLNINNKLLELVKRESSIGTARPRFIYTHFEMPHWPFYFDENNQLREPAKLLSEVNGAHVKAYTGYLRYTNDKLKDLMNTVIKNTKGKAVIVVMGDHGYRVHLDSVSDNHFFKNLNAVYLPGKDYHLLSDSSSGVNQFRLIFNTIFKQSFPVLKDSAVFLRDKIK